MFQTTRKETLPTQHGVSNGVSTSGELLLTPTPHHSNWGDLGGEHEGTKTRGNRTLLTRTEVNHRVPVAL